MSSLVVGIDLGTTNSCASIYLNGRLKLLENAEGNHVTPSFVYFADIAKDKIVVGPYAKKMAEQKPECGVYEFKRMIGCNFNESSVQKNLSYYSFVVEKGKENQCVVVLQQQETVIRKTIEEVTCMLLKKIRKDISAKMKKDVCKAVITVPAYFNVQQREATLKAAKLAGFSVLKLLNEPTAASLNFFFEKKLDHVNTLYLVYDFGGGTFDVAVLKKAQSDVETIAVDGDSHLGGSDFDALIVDYVCEHLLKHYKYDAKKDRRTMRRLQIKSEEAKKTLSFIEETEIVLEGLVSGQDAVVITLTRKQFETMAQHLFKLSIEILDLCLKNAKILKSQIKEVILAGGSTRIPRIQKMLGEFFGRRDLEKFINPEECVANGAAIQAAMLSKHPEQKMDGIKIRDVIPLSLGSSSHVDKMLFVIKRNSPIPAFGRIELVTSENYQTSVSMNIYEGERANSRKNRFLGKFVLTNLTEAPAGQTRLILILYVDDNGILTATAKEEFRNNTKSLKIEYTKNQRSDAEIKNTLRDAEMNRAADEAFLEFAKLKGYLITYLVRFLYNMEHRNLTAEYFVVCEFCRSNSAAARNFEYCDKAKIETMLGKCDKLLVPIAKRLNFEIMPQKPL